MQQQCETPGLELRVRYMRQKPARTNNNDDEYLNKLKSLGVKVLQSLYPAFFSLKNGLQYPGMATTKVIQPNTTLVTVPENLILSSVKALRQPELGLVFKQPFYNLEDSWEDRVLLTYCLFLHHSKSNTNIFSQMVSHMSKDIDIAFTWKQQQLNLIIDKTIKKAVSADKQSFEQQWKQFEEIQKKYEVLQQQRFNKSNYLWLFIHITSRCFGTKVQYISFVPFCQFFNHHSSSVYYQTDMIDMAKVTDKEEYENQSSDGSNDSEEYLEQGQFAYHQIDRIEIKWGSKNCLKLKKLEKQAIQSLQESLLQKVEAQLNWKDFSILFAGHFITRVKLAKNEYIEGRKKYQPTLKSLQQLKQILQKYIQMVKTFYIKKFGKKYSYKVQNRQNLSSETSKKFVRPDPFQCQTKFTEFYLKNGRRDKFLQNNQVYFCYGQRSNRILLLRYGFTIQGNKYEHVWLSFPINAQLKEFPDLLERVQKLGISLRRKYRINYCRLNIDMIVFFRLKRWNLYGVKSLEQDFQTKKQNKERFKQIINQMSCLMYTT